MAVRDDFTAGEVLAAADLNDTFASKLDLAGGKILQIVRATDSTQRVIASATLVDFPGMSITITPQKSDSAILFVFSLRLLVQRTDDVNAAFLVITDADNNAVSPTQRIGMFGYTGTSTRGLNTTAIVIGYATPATTSAVTYKLRGSTQGSDNQAVLENNLGAAQMYALEVSA